MSGNRTRIGLVGLGVIGRVHHRVLATRPDVEIVFVVDPGSADLDTSAPRFRSQRDAWESRGSDVDLTVVATPTDTHLDVVGEALRHTSGLVLSEKPLTRDEAELERFESDHAEHLGRVRVVDHMSFAPEVVWAADLAARHDWGPPSTVLASYNDPYVLKTPEERRSYVTSWIDSGANQLAVLMRFTDGLRVRRHQQDDDGMRAVTEVDHDGGRATLVSNWRTGDSSKQTVLRWPDGREVFLDHTSMTGIVLQDGSVEQHRGHDGTVDRKRAHYSGLYDALLAGDADETCGLERARVVARLLSAAVADR